MNRLVIFLVALLMIAPAQSQPSVNDIAFASIEDNIKSDIEYAFEALNTDDFHNATTALRRAGANSNRLAIRAVSKKVESSVPSFQPENASFVLAQSSTIAIEGLFDPRETYERRFKDDNGRIVTVRVFGEERDLSNFQFIADDATMLKKEDLEIAQMRGETAIKKRGAKGGLSVLMMSEKDHALIEVESNNEDVVMDFIKAMESSSAK